MSTTAPGLVDPVAALAGAPSSAGAFSTDRAGVRGGGGPPRRAAGFRLSLAASAAMPEPVPATVAIAAGAGGGVAGVTAPNGSASLSAAEEAAEGVRAGVAGVAAVEAAERGGGDGRAAGIVSPASGSAFSFSSKRPFAVGLAGAEGLASGLVGVSSASPKRSPETAGPLARVAVSPAATGTDLVDPISALVSDSLSSKRAPRGAGFLVGTEAGAGASASIVSSKRPSRLGGAVREGIDVATAPAAGVVPLSEAAAGCEAAGVEATAGASSNKPPPLGLDTGFSGAGALAAGVSEALSSKRLGLAAAGLAAGLAVGVAEEAGAEATVATGVAAAAARDAGEGEGVGAETGALSKSPRASFSGSLGSGGAEGSESKGTPGLASAGLAGAGAGERVSESSRSSNRLRRLGGALAAGVEAGAGDVAGAGLLDGGGSPNIFGTGGRTAGAA